MEDLDPVLGKGPPADPEEWSDEQWILWLEATDGDATAKGGAVGVTAASRIVHSSGGQLLGQAMLGMANAIYGRSDDEVVVVAEDDSEPDRDEPFTVHLNLDHPEQSSVVFRNVSEPGNLNGRD